jgi:beta-mannosidase
MPTPESSGAAGIPLVTQLPGRPLVLDGAGWQLRGCLGEEWQWHTGPSERWDAAGWYPARVPGSVLDDLWRAGAIADPYHERNSLRAEWVAGRSWIYRRRLVIRPLRPGQRAVLRFGGVDYAATVLVDGTVVARHEGMFTPFDVDVTAGLQDGGEHLLAVVVHAAPDSEPQVGVTRRVRVHKPRMGYGWDFCPRLVHQGIWQPVRLYLDGVPPRLDVGTRLSADRSVGTVTIAVPGRIRLLDEGIPVATADGRRIDVPSPRLWWPNGVGEPHLYQLAVDTGTGPVTCEIGFRQVELRPNDGAPASAAAYCFAVNGRRIYANGWNWVPVDALYGVPRPAKLAHLLRLAAGAHVNLLRVWGGGLVETAEFYQLCDRLGLMIWQDFSMSSSSMGSVPADDPAFVSMMAAEARDIIRARRRHPSLVAWCGGNELAASVPGRDDLPLDDAAPVLGALHQAVRDHDPDRLWFPSTPSGPRFLNRLDIIAEDPEGLHDVHGPWEHQGLRAHNALYDAGTCLFHSEVGVEGMTNQRSLEALIDPGHRWPADRGNPVYEHLGAWWNNAGLVQRSFGRPLADLGLLRRASQHLQFDGLRYALEADRRRAFRCSGTLAWQFNESYPNAWCTAAVDYRGDPKPAYHGVRRAYESPHVCAQFDTWAWGGAAEASAEVWVWGGAARVTARFVDAAGRVAAAEQFQVAPRGDEPVRAGKITVALPRLGSDVFLLDLRADGPGGRPPARNRYLMSRTGDLGPLLDLPPAVISLRRAAGGIRLSHEDGPAALGVVLTDGRPYDAAGWAVFGDNMLDLLPGETRLVTVDWDAAQPAAGPVTAEGWNARACLPA